MGKYHLTKRKNNTCQQQQYSAISPENKQFSHKYLLRFSCSIYRNSASLANRLSECQKPYWRRKITLTFPAVTGGSIAADLPPHHVRSTAGRGLTRYLRSEVWPPRRRTWEFLSVSTHRDISGVENFYCFHRKYCTSSCPSKFQ